MRFTLRAYQQEGVEKIRAAYRSGRVAPLFVLPTGGGKTAVFSHIAEGVRANNRRVTILVHRQELLMQASRSLDRLGVSHGIISPKFAQTRDQVQVASVQTIVRRLDRLDAPDLIIIDEAHHATSETYRKILKAFPIAHVLGVTATPCRSDSKGLGLESGGIFDSLILGPSIANLIAEGHLVRPVVYAPPVGIDLEGVHRTMGDYDKRELGERIDKPKITGDAVGHYLRYCRSEPAIAFCVSISHAEHVAAEFQRAGVRAVRVDGSMEDAARKAAIEGLGNGTIDVLTSADLIGEGVDIPRVSAAILLRPTQSLALYLQQVGRALRPSPGKTRALILDHVGNVMRHGFPDDDREWELNNKEVSSKRETQLPLVRIDQCDKCFFVYEIGPDSCPACGNKQPQKVRKIEHADGELKELDRAAIEAARKAAKMEVGQARTLQDLKAIEKARGYKNGWAEHRFKARGGKSR